MGRPSPPVGTHPKQHPSGQLASQVFPLQTTGALQRRMPHPPRPLYQEPLLCRPPHSSQFRPCLPSQQHISPTQWQPPKPLSWFLAHLRRGYRAARQQGLCGLWGTKARRAAPKQSPLSPRHSDYDALPHILEQRRTTDRPRYRPDTAR
jgi:hypothetical protein